MEVSRPAWALVATVAAVILLAARASGHHSISAIYDFGTRLPLEGHVVQFEFVNPHPFLTLEVVAGERPRRWRLEMDNRRELAELGFADGFLKAGDRVSVVVNPARARPNAGYVRLLERPADGFRYRHHD